MRDYVIAGDGWIKDGDYNTTFSRTVQPLPYHAETLYKQAPGTLEGRVGLSPPCRGLAKTITPRYVTSGAAQ